MILHTVYVACSVNEGWLAVRKLFCGKFFVIKEWHTLCQLDSKMCILFSLLIISIVLPPMLTVVDLQVKSYNSFVIYSTGEFLA